MDTLTTIKNSKYVYFGFDPADEDTNNVWKATPVVSQSPDGINWQVIKEFPELTGLRDGCMKEINGHYYLIGTLAFYKTDDFETFTTIDVSLLQQSGYTNIWAPELFQDKNGAWHIVYCASTGGVNHTYIADFDPTTEIISNAYQSVDVDSTSIDPDITYLNGKYYLWLSGARLFSSSNYLGKYTSVPTNIVNDSSAKWYEAPEMLVVDDQLILYQDKITGSVSGVSDSGYMVCRTSDIKNMNVWSDEIKISADINMRHGSFLYYSNNVALYPDYSSYDNSWDKRVKVQAKNRSEIEVMDCFYRNTFYVTWEQNNSYSLQFTAYDDSSLAFQLLQSESTIFFDGQQYIVKQCIPDYVNNVFTKQIVATHIYNEIQYIRQYNTKTGTLTYSVQDVLSYYLDNNPYNIGGFTYQVFGDFEKEQITDLGNNSGKDMLSQILSTWSQAIIFPDNKNIRVYTPQAFAKNFGKRIGYLYNSSEVTITIDSTTLSNKVKCYGKQVENDTDTNVVKYYFDPFFVEDTTSIQEWGVHLGEDINDERFTNVSSMKSYALSQLQLDPTISVAITYSNNEKPVAGEQRLLQLAQNEYRTTVNVVGYTWYPFDYTQATTLELDNLQASILNTQATINNKINELQKRTQDAINKAITSTTAYVTPIDPTINNDVRTGDFWVRGLDQD